MATDVRTILLALLTIGLAHGHTGTLFIYENTVSGSFSSWLLTYTIDIQPYQTHLQGLKDQIELFNNAITELDEYKTWNQTMIIRRNIRSLIMEESRLFMDEYEQINSIFQDTSSLSIPRADPRTRRSLIPIIGDLLSDLFGVGTEKQLRRLKSAMNDLRDNQDQFAHVLSKSLTLINKTNEQVRTNRQALKKLSSALNYFQTEVQQVLYQWRHSIIPEMLYIELVTRLHTIFHLVSSTMRQIHFEISDMATEVQTALNGHVSPKLIKPSVLANTLRRIRAKLPQGTTLPFNTDKQGLMTYYHYLQPSVLPGPYKIHVAVAIPLLHTDNSFELYRAIQIPVPNPENGLGANYLIEHEHLLVSTDKNTFSFIKDSELDDCRQLPVCTFASPLYRITQYPTCLTSLFLNDDTRIGIYCKKIISNMPPIPIVQHMFGRHWIMSTHRPFNITVRCPIQGSSTRTVLGIQTIDPGENCSVVSPLFTIPTSTYGASSIEQETRLIATVEIAKLSRNIWNTDTVLPRLTNNTQLPDLTDLPDVATLPIKHLHDLLNNTVTKRLIDFKPDSRLHPVLVAGSVLGIVTLTGVLSIVLLSVLRLQYKRHSSRQTNQTTYFSLRRPKKRTYNVAFKIPDKDTTKDQNIEVTEPLNTDTTIDTTNPNPPTKQTEEITELCV